MKIFSKKLVKAEDLEKRIKTICSFNNAKCEFIQGRILTVDRTNVSFIEPHRVNIKYKDSVILLLYFDKDNLFLFDRSTPISLDKLYAILQALREC